MKTDNGFRPGFFVKVEDAMSREFPGTDLRVSPHITSKVHTWKKNYGALSQVLGRSSIRFNLNGDYKIDCDESQWREILKAEPGWRFLCNKSWPYYDDWKILFGKDKAVGEDSVDAREAFHQTGTHTAQGNGAEGSDYHVSSNPFSDGDNVNENFTPEIPSDSAFSTAGGSQVTGRASKKRKGGDALDRLVDVIAKIHDETNKRLEYLANRIGYEFDLTKTRKEVFALVGDIPGLSLDQVFDASAIILEKVERLDFFMSLPDGARQAFVFRALEKFGAI